jgi:hypothetical protein
MTVIVRICGLGRKDKDGIRKQTMRLPGLNCYFADAAFNAVHDAWL